MEPFTHIYCDKCDDIKPAKCEANAIRCGACDTALLGSVKRSKANAKTVDCSH